MKLEVSNVSNISLLNQAFVLYSSFRVKKGRLYASFPGRNEIKFIYTPTMKTDKFEEEKADAVKEWASAIQDALKKDGLNLSVTVTEGTVSIAPFEKKRKRNEKRASQVSR